MSSSSSSPNESHASVDHLREIKAEHRKSTKPLMEKKRRARINDCLGELKTLILEAMKKDSSRYSKLEKADILEMTVKHLRQTQRRQIAAAMASDPSVISKYQSGFNECAGEVARYLSSVEGVNGDVKSRVLNHLANTMRTTDNNMVATGSSPTTQALPVPVSHAMQTYQTTVAHAQMNPMQAVNIIPQVHFSAGTDINNNNTQFLKPVFAPVVPSMATMTGALQVFPAGLPAAEYALVIPNIAQPGIFPVYACETASTSIVPNTDKTVPVAVIQQPELKSEIIKTEPAALDFSMKSQNTGNSGSNAVQKVELKAQVLKIETSRQDDDMWRPW